MKNKISSHGPVFSDDILGFNDFKFNNLVCLIADGDLPQGIVDGSFLFVEIGTSFKKGDLVIIRTKSIPYEYKIKYAEEIESDYFGRVLMATRLFAKEEPSYEYQRIEKKIDIPYELNKELEHNVKMLLNLYRKVNFRVEERIEDLKLETYESKRKHLEELVISILEIDTTINSKKIEEQLISVSESLFLLQIMDKALERLRNYPDNGELYGKILELRFFNKEIYSHDIIMEKVSMSRSSYYRHLNKAIQSYSAMIFGYALPEIRAIMYNENIDLDNLKVAERNNEYF